jgi:hypothetical protein
VKVKSTTKKIKLASSCEGKVSKKKKDLGKLA